MPAIRYDGLDLILGTVSVEKVRGAAQEIFAKAGEKMNAKDNKLEELYRHLLALDYVGEVMSDHSLHMLTR